MNAQQMQYVKESREKYDRFLNGMNRNSSCAAVINCGATSKSKSKAMEILRDSNPHFRTEADGSRTWVVKIFDGHMNHTRICAGTYEEVTQELFLLPPGYIWSCLPVISQFNNTGSKK